MTDYREKYEQALERARDVYTYYCDDTEQLRKIESIFPELKEEESENEQIRNELIKFVKNSTNPYSDQQKKYLEWLEKQEEQKSIGWNASDEAHLHSLVTHLEQWIDRHPDTTGADVQGENLEWLKHLCEELKG